MILYSKRTNVHSSHIYPTIVYIYWDFDTRSGGHLDKDRNVISRPHTVLNFRDLDSFYNWRTKFKNYWEEPTRNIIEDYLQVDEGL